MTQKRSHSEAHKEALRDAQQLRNNEQLVGNYIRRCNPVLYAQLLLEAKAPRSNTVDQLQALLGTAGSSPTPQKVGAPNSAQTSERPPLPIMNIR